MISQPEHYGADPELLGNVDPTSTNGLVPVADLPERGAAAVYNSFRTVNLDATHMPLNWLTPQGGVDFRNYGNRQVMTLRSNGANTSLDSYIPSAIENTPLSQYTQLVTLPGSYPAGTATSYLVPDLNKANQLFNIFSTPPWTRRCFPAARGPAPPRRDAVRSCRVRRRLVSSNGTVREDDTGYWFEAGWNAQFYGVPFRGNVGGRYVQTSTESQGIAFNATTKTFQSADVKHGYHDFLPSINAVLEPTDNFLIRMNGCPAYVMTRPSLTALLPGVSTQPVRRQSAGLGHHRQIRIWRALPRQDRRPVVRMVLHSQSRALLSFAFFYKYLDDIEVSAEPWFGPFNANPLGIPSSALLSFCPAAALSRRPAQRHQYQHDLYDQRYPEGRPALCALEIDWQQPFDFLPHPFDNFGVLGNVSFVQARQNYILVPATATTAAITTQGDLTGLSRDVTYNATFYYDDSIFQARISAAFRQQVPGQILRVLDLRPQRQ